VAVLIAALPFVSMCFTVSLWDCVQPMVLGLPFNLFWLMTWIVLTSVCLRIIYILDTRRERAEHGSKSGDGAR
jgi:hypothetical protein